MSCVVPFIHYWMSCAVPAMPLVGMPAAAINLSPFFNTADARYVSVFGVVNNGAFK